ncbi:MAG: FHA domain-containing protein [Oscillospiraceae bacterium]|nr:FHA domain-containing protein [Oscillospiraceae bacterium]
MPEILSELWQMLSGLQVPDLVLSAAAVVILDMFAISVILAVGRESTLCRKRWRKVSANLELRRKEEKKEIHHPLEADEILLGRHSSADIQLKDPSVSRYHAVMTVTGGIWTVTDLNSKSGTFVNDQRVRQKKLAPGDCIRLGNAKLWLAKRPAEQEE